MAKSQIVIEDQKAGIAVYKTEADLIKPEPTLFHALPELGSKAPKLKSISDQNECADQYAQGFKDGEAQAQGLYEKTLAVLQNSLDTILKDLDGFRRQIEHSHLLCVSECLEEVFPALVQASATSQITECIRAISEPGLQGNIVITAHSQVIETIKAHGLDAEKQAILKLVSDDSLGPHVLNANWAGGGQRIDPQQTAMACRKHVDAALAQLNEESKGEPHV